MADKFTFVFVLLPFDAGQQLVRPTVAGLCTPRSLAQPVPSSIASRQELQEGRCWEVSGNCKEIHFLFRYYLSSCCGSTPPLACCPGYYHLPQKTRNPPPLPPVSPATHAPNVTHCALRLAVKMAFFCMESVCAISLWGGVPGRKALSRIRSANPSVQP